MGRAGLGWQCLSFSDACDVDLLVRWGLRWEDALHVAFSRRDEKLGGRPRFNAETAVLRDLTTTNDAAAEEGQEMGGGGLERQCAL